MKDSVSVQVALAVLITTLLFSLTRLSAEGVQLTVLTRPEALVSSSGNVVEGSVIQIYCTVEMDTTVTFTWTLNGSALLNDPPHIRIREDNCPVRSASLLTDDSTSVLTVDNFRDTDNGLYQCTAITDVTSSKGVAVTLVALPSSSSGTLMLINQPTANEPTDLHPLLNDNRTGIALGDSTPLGDPGPGPLLTCTVGHHGDELMNYVPPSVVWVRNGQVVDDTDPRITLTTTTMSNGRVTSSLTITNFTLSDAGVYQCVFTDDSDGGDTELVTSIPYRLDTGTTIRIERVSPEVIILRPPEKLVIEARVSGDYSVLFWGKDTNSFIPRLMRPQEFPNFYDIFVRDTTTKEDFGHYIVAPHFKPGTVSTYTLVPTGGVDFAVISPDNPITTVLSDSVVTISEGRNGAISCRSMGAPVPSITWEFNNQTTVFEQTDTVTPYEATLTGDAGNRRVHLAPGNIVSTLHIVSARYPDHDGVYTCTGTNADGLSVASSSASITLQVQVVDCGGLPHPSNGRVDTPSGTTFMRVAVYTCYNGYKIRGNRQRICEADGVWYPKAPICVVVDCGPLVDPLNGQVSTDSGTTFNSVAVYSCDKGYMINGTNRRVCLANGEWSMSTFSCVPVNCGALNAPVNGHVDTPQETTFTNTATYSCDPGYNLTGCAAAECLSSGSWSCNTPFCADNALIQLKFGPTGHCVIWSDWKIQMMYGVMRSSIFKAILRAGHLIPKQNVQEGHFSCCRSKTETTYRTTITGTERVSAADYAQLIQQWVGSGVTTRVQWYVIKIDKNCPVSIMSMDEEECV